MKSRICPELRDRVDFHLTNYRQSHDGADKVWISIDGERIFSCKHYSYEKAAAEAFYCGLRGSEITSVLGMVEIHSPGDFGSAMRDYLDLPIHSALDSANPLIRAFAIIDGRVGKKKFAKLEVSNSDHPLVQAFFWLRVKPGHIQQALGADSP